MFTRFSLIISWLLVSLVVYPQYDTASAILQASKMSKITKGTVQQNYWVQDSSGGVYKNVYFPVTGLYRFDFTGHGTRHGTGLKEVWSNLEIQIDDIPKADVSINSKIPTDGPWTALINVTKGRHKVAELFTNDNGSTSFKLYMGLLYITPTTNDGSRIPPRYDSIASQLLPTFGTAFLNSNNFTVSQLRGMCYNRAGIWATLDDMRAFAAYGGNLLRLYVEFENYTGINARWKEGELNFTDSVVAIARQLGFYVNLVCTEDKQTETIWGNPSLQNDYVSLIGQLAARYKDSTQVACISLFNEPDLVGHLGEWCRLAQRAANEIRRSDTNHVIVFPHCTGIQDIWRLTIPIPFKNVVYEYHCYLPYTITHQGISEGGFTRTEYPNYTGSPYYDPIYQSPFNRDDLDTSLNLEAAFSEKWNAPIYIGEFSMTNWSPTFSSCRYVRDCIDIFERRGYSWTYLSFRRAECYDAEIPPDAYYKYPYVLGQPQLPFPVQKLDSTRTDTTCTIKYIVDKFRLNKH